MMQQAEQGTVTILFTDIEGSTWLWQEHPDAMTAALARHHVLLNQAIASHHGSVFQIVGDGFHAMFPSALDGLNAALDAQRALFAETWGEIGSLRVRMALDTGHADIQPDKYDAGEYTSGEYVFLARAARLLSTGYGGQILLSAPAAESVRDRLPASIGLHDLGIHRVKDFQYQQIFQAAVPELPSDFPPLHTLASLPNNLPIQLTSFIGREKEIREVEAQLETVRLLTLTGPGGAGKTRLSLQVAADRIDQFKHGVWFVELAPLSDRSLVPQIVATTLGLREQPGRVLLDLLQDYLRAKTVLLVLDNCEHLIEPCAQLADTLLHSAPNLKILATSREPLGIGGETTYPVPSLSFPSDPLSSDENGEANPAEALARFEAVQLFVDRARRVQPSFAVTPANAPALAEICRRLDGIPLALELAAARVKGLTLEQIARRLDDRFRLLTSGSRTAMPHHQTLQATIEWSYGLLSEQERALYERLSVFAGGWTLEAAERICEGAELESADVLDLLMRLVDKSLVVADQGQEDARYRFLDTIRQFARDKFARLDENDRRRVCDRHLDYFLAFVREIDETVRGTEQESGLVRLDRELDNVRAALAWSAESDNTEAEMGLALALWRYWRVRSYFSEGRRWLADALARGEACPPTMRAKALLGAGSLANYQADYAQARAFLEASLTLHRQLKDNRGIGLSLNLLADGKTMTGEFAGARRDLQESVAIFRKLNDPRGTGYALYFLGSLLLRTGELKQARPLLEESLARLTRVGDKWWIGNTMLQLGWCLNRQGEHDNALQRLQEALDISTQFNDTRGTGRALMYIGEAKYSQGEYAAARDKYTESLKMFREIGDKWAETSCLEGLGYIAAAQNDARRAAQLLGSAEQMHERLGAPLLAVYRESTEASAKRARAQLGARDFSEAWAEGRALNEEQAIELAMSDSSPAL